jgi:hypothetical protein
LTFLTKCWFEVSCLNKFIPFKPAVKKDKAAKKEEEKIEVICVSFVPLSDTVRPQVDRVRLTDIFGYGVEVQKKQVIKLKQYAYWYSLKKNFAFLLYF